MPESCKGRDPVQHCMHLPPRLLKRSIISRCLMLILCPQYNENIRKQLPVFIPASGWMHRQYQATWFSEHLKWKAKFPLQWMAFIPLSPININEDPITKSPAVHWKSLPVYNSGSCCCFSLDCVQRGLFPFLCPCFHIKWKEMILTFSGSIICLSWVFRSFKMTNML